MQSDIYIFFFIDVYHPSLTYLRINHIWFVNPSEIALPNDQLLQLPILPFGSSSKMSRLGGVPQYYQDDMRSP